MVWAQLYCKFIKIGIKTHLLPLLVTKGKSLSRVQLFVTSWTIYSPWNSLGQNTRVGSLSLFQEIFPTQGLNPGLLHCRRILYHLSHLGSPSNNYLTIIPHENSTEFYLMEIYPICMGDTPLSMRFSRQEYWSGVPLPSPDTLKNLYILG